MVRKRQVEVYETFEVMKRGSPGVSTSRLPLRSSLDRA
jgi:hypothetical protein